MCVSCNIHSLLKTIKVKTSVIFLKTRFKLGWITSMLASQFQVLSAMSWPSICFTNWCKRIWPWSKIHSWSYRIYDRKPWNIQLKARKMSLMFDILVLGACCIIIIINMLWTCVITNGVFENGNLHFKILWLIFCRCWKLTVVKNTQKELFCL